MTRLVFSSEFYYIKAADLKKLPLEDTPLQPIKSQDIPLVLLRKECNAKLIDVKGIVGQDQDDDFIKVKIAYYTFSALISLLLCLIKPIKRHYYLMNKATFTVRLDDIINAKLPRGERNAGNAYQWTNKRWQISKEEAQKRYAELRESMQKKGYDKKSPMFVMLNRRFGAKDQLFQGHHRIGICKELGITEVSILFWTAPATFAWFKKLM